jgi:hypothetical protein
MENAYMKDAYTRGHRCSLPVLHLHACMVGDDVVQQHMLYGIPAVTVEPMRIPDKRL